ncbi:hypothetical protein EI94DRAFT_1798668 [Lactarius quietus]|nr:hypothetical protein EI94DRAFT_1798668 [Lactarius quietus]
MSDIDEENDKAGGQDSSRPGVSDGDVDKREDEKEDFDDFFDAGGSAVIGDHPSELDYEEYMDLMPIHPNTVRARLPRVPAAATYHR